MGSRSSCVCVYVCVPLILEEARESAGTCQCLMMSCYVVGVQGVRDNKQGSDDTRTDSWILDSFNINFSHMLLR